MFNARLTRLWVAAHNSHPQSIRPRRLVPTYTMLTCVLVCPQNMQSVRRFVGGRALVTDGRGSALARRFVIQRRRRSRAHTCRCASVTVALAWECVRALCALSLRSFLNWERCLAFLQYSWP